LNYELINLIINLMFLKNSTALLKNVQLNTVKPLGLCLNQSRTRTTCSGDGREKSVKTAMERYFRIDPKVWIRSQPGNSKFHRK